MPPREDPPHDAEPAERRGADAPAGGPAAGAVWRVMALMLLLGGLAYPAVFLWVAWRRDAYPFELEWMEGGVLDHVLRVRDGLALYVPPDVDFVPFACTPLYYWVCAPFVGLLGEGFLPLRLVSVLASLGAMLALLDVVRRASGSAWAGALAACLYAATYRAAGAWFDLGRADALFVLLALLGVRALWKGERARDDAFAALWLTLAFLARQSALVVAAPLALHCLLARRGARRFRFAGLLALGVVGSSLVLDWTSGGWFRFYVFELPAGQERDLSAFRAYWWSDVLKRTWLPVALLPFALAPLRRRLGARRSWLLLATLAGLVGASWGSRLHSGHYDNVAMPGYAGLAVLSGLALRELFAWRGRPTIAAVAVWTLALLQFGWLAYSPHGQLPTAVDRKVGERFVQQLANSRGEVLVPAHGYLGRMAGKHSCAHQRAVRDVLRGPDRAVAEGLAQRFRKQLAAGFYRTVVADRSWAFIDEVRATYPAETPAFSDGTVFWTRTGMPSRPSTFHRR